jgi:hypothetical protein
MRLRWVVHRFDRSANAWVDTDGGDAERRAGVFADIDPELELSLLLDGELLVRDVVWPLAWHLCLEPVTGLADGADRWSYRGFATGTLYDLRATGDVVEFGRAGGPPAVVPAALWWPAVVDAGIAVVAAAERDRGPDDANVGMLRAPRDRAAHALAALGLRARGTGTAAWDARAQG